MSPTFEVRSLPFDVPAPRVGGAEVCSIAFAEATLAATDCVVHIIDHTATDDDRVACHTALADTRNAIPRKPQYADQVVRL